jgi:flagellar basal body P-ring protein FlgI
MTKRDTLNNPAATSIATTAACLLALTLALGCMGPIFRPQSPDASLKDVKTETSNSTELVGSVAHPYGLNFVKIENVALVTGLAGTGEDPAPSPQRAALLAELNRRQIDHPNEVLASPNTALVLVRGFLRPGVQAGEKFDVEVRTPSKSGTKSLRGGWLMETRLSEAAVLGGQIHTGHDTATAQGPILVDPSVTADSNISVATQGRVLNGGVVTKSRSLGLVLDHKHQSVRLSQLTAKAVNDRFCTYADGRRVGCAKPKTDEFIELTLHPRYKENVARYVRVVRSIALHESPTQLLERLKLLHDQLMDPVTCETAALRLEAIGGEEAIKILKEGAKAEDHEVQFHAAEALAYLDVTEAVAPLARAAVEEPAYRIDALAALGAMEDATASEALYDMLKSKSAETRYGAFRALTAMEASDPRIHGEKLGGKFDYYILDVEGPPMIHATSSHKSEIVLFGKEHQFKLPMVLDAGPQIMINGLNGDQITVSRFMPNGPTQQRVVSTNVDDVIRAIFALEGDYPDVVQMLQQAKNAGALPSRFRVNALPEPGRTPEHDDSTKKDEPKLLTQAP